MSLDLFGPTTGAGGVTIRPGDNRSFTAADTFHKDCSSPDLDDGTEFQAAWFNQIVANLRGVARGNGSTGGGAAIVTEDNADDALLLKAIQHLIQRGRPLFASDTGAANQMVVALSPKPAELKHGMAVRFKKSANPNTGAATLILNGFAEKPVRRMNGSALQNDDLPASAMCEVMYDGVTDTYVVINFTGNYVANGPFSEVNLFQGDGALSVPHATYTKRAFTAATIGAHADVAFSLGSCVINTAGRYLVTSTSICGVDPASYSSQGQYPCAILKNAAQLSNGTGFVLDQASSGVRVKEVSGSNVFVADFAHNDVLDASIYQGSAGGATALFSTQVLMSIVRVR